MWPRWVRRRGSAWGGGACTGTWGAGVGRGAATARRRRAGAGCGAGARGHLRGTARGRGGAAQRTATSGAPRRAPAPGPTTAPSPAGLRATAAMAPVTRSHARRALHREGERAHVRRTSSATFSKPSAFTVHQIHKVGQRQGAIGAHGHGLGRARSRPGRAPDRPRARR